MGLCKVEWETGEDNNGGRENRQMMTTDVDMNERRWYPGPGPIARKMGRSRQIQELFQSYHPQSLVMS